MTNQEKLNYKPFPLCDGHIHITMPHSVDTTVKIMQDTMEYFNYERMAMLGLQQDSKTTGDPGNNLKALYCKSVMNKANPMKRVYAFSGIYHLYDERDTSEGYLNQIKKIYDMGFDGLKILDGKPKMRKKLNRRLDDPIFEKMYAFAEEKNMPVTMHLGDPPEYWDINKISEYALKVGWFCDETYPTLDEMRGEVYSLLEKYPKLRLTLAHFFFLSQDLEECVRLFETYPNMSFDLTPGGEMFVGFSQRPDEWREFFIKYSDRIYLGTDTYNYNYHENLEDYGNNTEMVRLNLVRRCLETSEPFEHPNKGRLVPLALDDRTLMAIYHDNFIARLGEPKKVNFEAAAANVSEMRELLTSKAMCHDTDERNDMELKNFDIMLDYFTK